MKNSLIYILVILFASCNKEPVNNLVQTPLPLAPQPIQRPINVAPNVHAGSDIYLVIPDNSCTLRGSVQYPQSIETTEWKKISGPTSFLIENPGSLTTKVSNLEKGIYVFELTVKDKAGLIGKNTLLVYVTEKGSGTNEIIFKDIEWNCPMGCHMYIENVLNLLPTGISFRVYVRRDNSTQWNEVTWTIYNSGLEIMGNPTELDPNDTPDVKIIF